MKRVASGMTILAVSVTFAKAAGARDHNNVQRAQPSSPMVGLIYIEGAEPGDAIAVTFRKIRPNRGTAWQPAAP